MAYKRITTEEFCVMQKIGRGKWEEVFCEDTLSQAKAAMSGCIAQNDGSLYKIQTKRKPKSLKA